MAKLVQRDKATGAVREIPLLEPVSTVGRVADREVFLQDDSVSRRHAEIRCVDGQWFVVDLASLNGVFVNDHRVTKGSLNEGDEVRFGSVRLRFSHAPCTADLDRRGGGVFARFLGGLQETASAFDGQVGNFFEFISSGSEKVQQLETDIVSTLRSRTDRFEQAYRQLTILYRVSQHINSDIDTDKVLGTCLDLAVTTLKSDRGVLLLHDKGTDDLEVRLAKSRDPNETVLQRAGWLKSIARRVFEMREAMVLSPEFATDNTAVLTHAPNQGSFICAPVLGREDDIKGVLYFDSASGNAPFRKGDIDFLATFGAQLAMALDRDSLIAEVVGKKEMEREMDIAQDIQRRLLPASMPSSPRFTLVGRSLPSKQVGGDWYGYSMPDGDRSLGLVVADVSGKGIPAALVVSQVRSALKIYGEIHLPPGEAISQLNDFLLGDFDGSMYATLVYAVFDFDRGVLRYANAGHEWPMRVRADSEEVEFLDKSCKPCGLFDGVTFDEVEVPFMPGDRIVFPTDGILDAESTAGEKYGIDRLHAAVLATRSLDTQGCLDAIFAEVEEFARGGGPQFDDMTLVVLDVTPGATGS